MLNRNFVAENIESNSVEGVWQRIKNLSADEKAELLQKLLGKESGLIVVSASSHLADYVIAQMSQLSSEGLTYVLTYGLGELDGRIASEGDRSSN